MPLERTRDLTVHARLHQGWDPADPLLSVSLSALAREAGAGRIRPATVTVMRPLIEHAFAIAGTAKPWGRQAAHVPRADGTDGTPRTVPMDAREVRDLTRFMRTACLVLTAALTGMRESELMELRHGCRSATEHGDGMIRYQLAGKLIKGQPLGGTDEQWVVIQAVHDAVGMAEQLSHHVRAHGDLIFGRFAFDDRYDGFRAWVNGPAGQRLGLAPIPASPVTLRMLRQTLAHELAYRPGGLLAAKIALKHLKIATTEGYAARPGGAQGKLLAEIAETKPAATSRSCSPNTVTTKTASCPQAPGPGNSLNSSPPSTRSWPTRPQPHPNIVPGDQHILNLLSKRAGALHLATANYCWFTDPSRALCLKLAGTPTADKPLAGMCDSARCPQATHHPCHRPVWAEAVTSATAFIGTLGRTRTAERTRLQAELDRAQRVLASIDAVAPPPGKAEDRANQR